MKQYVVTILGCFLFKRSGDADMEVALKMVEYLGSEMDYVPWQAARRELSYVEKMLTRSNLYGKFKVPSYDKQILVTGNLNSINYISKLEQI